MIKLALMATVSHTALKIGMAAWKGKRGPNTLPPPRRDDAYEQWDAPPARVWEK